MPRPILDLIQKYAREPQSIHIQQKTLTVPTVEQVYYEVDRRSKIELLTRLIDLHDLKLGIIFCNTKRMVDDLVDHLEAQGYSADRLHGDMSQNLRDRVMNKFRKSGLEFLVATDVAARGIDVDDVQVVFNYDLPYDVEDYVHRIGRTGRAGRSGQAISFVSGREFFQIQQIERYTKMKIQRGKVPTLDEVEGARSSAILGKLRTILQSGEFKRQDHFIERLLEEGFTSTDIASALLHHFQGGESPPPSRPPRSEERERPERPPFREARDVRREPWSERPPRRREVSEGRVPVPQRPAKLPAAVVKPVTTPQVKPLAIPPAALPLPVQGVAVSAPPVTPPEPKPVVRKTNPPPLPPQPPGPSEKPVAQVPKLSRRTPDGQTCLHLNIGSEMGVALNDVVAAIQGETGLPAKVVGAVDIRERHLFVDVVAEHAHGIIAKLNRAEMKGRRLKVKVA